MSDNENDDTTKVMDEPAVSAIADGDVHKPGADSEYAPEVEGNTEGTPKAEGNPDISAINARLDYLTEQIQGLVKAFSAMAVATENADAPDSANDEDEDEYPTIDLSDLNKIYGGF